MKVVLDTNVFISGIFWKGLPHDILKLAERKQVQIISSSEILQELLGVLRRAKFKPYLDQAKATPDAVVQKIATLATIFSPREEIAVIKDDPSDNKFLSCALAGKTSFIVSGDKHLLSLKEFRGIPIVTPNQFLKRIRRK